MLLSSSAAMVTTTNAVSALIFLAVILDVACPLERNGKFPRFRHKGHPPPSEHPPGGLSPSHYYQGLPGVGGFTVSRPRQQQQYLLPQQRHYQRQTGQQQNYHLQAGRQQTPMVTTRLVNTKRKVINYRQEEKKILDRIIEKKVYDTRMRPKGVNSTRGQTVVKVNLFVRSFEKIDDVRMEYSFQITFRQQWNDHRLSYDDMNGRLKYLTLGDARKLWMPDTFFRNEKEGAFHDVILPNLYIRIFPNGDVLYSIRISLTLTCNMDLSLFPLDTQTCHLRIASYGWTTADVEYKWKQPDPVQFAKNLFLPGGFELTSYLNGSCDVVTATGEYSCLTVDMTFKRQIAYYLFTIYFPTVIIVFSSWMSFWLDHKSAPARVTLTVTTLLAMATTSASINNSLPPVAYTKAIDVWSNLCVTFVFLTLLEYALVNYAARADARANQARKEAEKEMEMRHNQNMQMLFDEEEEERLIMMQQQQQQQQQQHHMGGGEQQDAGKNSYRDFMHPSGDPMMRRVEGSTMIRGGENKLLMAAELPRDRQGRYQDGMQNGAPVGVVNSVLNSFGAGKMASEAKRIDVISRFIFPLSFAGFNVMYWSYYLTKSYYSKGLVTGS